VLFSSAAVYGAPAGLPVFETQSLNPVSPYGIHKVLAESMVADYSRLFGISSAVLRIFSAFGAGLRKQLFWDISHKIQNALNTGDTTIVLGGTGDETRDFIHANDVVLAALSAAKAMETTRGFELYNVGSGVETRIRDAAQILVDLAAPHLELQFNGKVRAGDPPRWVADVSRLRTLGLSPKRTLTEGLCEYASWFQSLPPPNRQ
jgi:UDP-glucose 4-epimerase